MDDVFAHGTYFALIHPLDMEVGYVRQRRTAIFDDKCVKKISSVVLLFLFSFASTFSDGQSMISVQVG